MVQFNFYKEFGQQKVECKWFYVNLGGPFRKIDEDVIGEL